MALEQKTTADGSITYYNPDVDETYHSTSGAYDEAMRKYAHALELAEIAGHAEKIRILDICFGMGYNSAAAIDVIRSVSKTVPIEIVGLEIDPTILHTIPNLVTSFDSFPLIQKASSTPSYETTLHQTHITIILGDARETICTLADTSYDVILLDPFSPKKTPELWSSSFFRQIYRVTAYNGRLATYSCARAVRDTLTEVGFRVTDGPCVGRRSPATLAFKDSE